MANKLYDVLIIGGGPAGLSVATGLVRQLHTALVIDSGVYRNARAHHMHNVAGFDHVDPAEFRAKARADLLRRYDTVQFQSATINEIKKLDNGQFAARDEEGNTYLGRKVVLASGIKDVMPDIDGYSNCWARGIFHCLFCHGYEERGGESAGFLLTSMPPSPSMAIHVSNMALQLAKKVTIYTHGDESLAASIKEAMQPPSSRVTFETRKIKKLAMASPNTESADIIVTLEDGTQTKESFIAHGPAAELNGPFIAQLGLELGQAGEVKVNPPFNETSVHGVFAAGDVATPMRAVPMAMSMGSFVAAGVASQVQAEKRLGEQ